MNRILVIGGAGTVGRQGRMRCNGDPVIYIRHGICSSSAPFVPFGEYLAATFPNSTFDNGGCRSNGLCRFCP